MREEVPRTVRPERGAQIPLGLSSLCTHRVRMATSAFARVAMGVWLAVWLAASLPGEVHANKSKARKTRHCSAPFPFEDKHGALQKELARRLNAAGWGRLIKKKELTVALVDLSKRGRRYYSGVNDNFMMYAASLPKIAILLTVIEAVEHKRVTWTHEFDIRLHHMITKSSNPDASWGTDIVGLLAIENTLRDPRYCFYDDKVGGLWVGRAYRRGAAQNRDPLKQLSHAATARQTARFYAMLDAGRLVSRHWSFRMLGLMSPPKHFHKFVGGLLKKRGVVFLARKSGTWRNFHADSALIEGPGRRYIAIALVNSSSGEKILRKLIVVLDDIIATGAHRKRGGGRK